MKKTKFYWYSKAKQESNSKLLLRKKEAYRELKPELILKRLAYKVKLIKRKRQLISL